MAKPKQPRALTNSRQISPRGEDLGFKLSLISGVSLSVIICTNSPRRSSRIYEAYGLLRMPPNPAKLCRIEARRLVAKPPAAPIYHCASVQHGCDTCFSGHYADEQSTPHSRKCELSYSRTTITATPHSALLVLGELQCPGASIYHLLRGADGGFCSASRAGLIILHSLVTSRLVRSSLRHPASQGEGQGHVRYKREMNSPLSICLTLLKSHEGCLWRALLCLSRGICYLPLRW